MIVEHLRAERDDLVALPGATSTVVGDGQQRLLRLLNDLLSRLSDDATDCTRLVRSAEVEVTLRRQAKLETALLNRRRIP